MVWSNEELDAFYDKMPEAIEHAKRQLGELSQDATRDLCMLVKLDARMNVLPYAFEMYGDITDPVYEGSKVSIFVAGVLRVIIDASKAELHLKPIGHSADMPDDLIVGLVLDGGLDFTPEAIRSINDYVHSLMGGNPTTRLSDQIVGEGLNAHWQDI